jgi:hypothetical protein
MRRNLVILNGALRSACFPLSGFLTSLFFLYNICSTVLPAKKIALRRIKYDKFVLSAELWRIWLEVAYFNHIGNLSGRSDELDRPAADMEKRPRRHKAVGLQITLSSLRQNPTGRLQVVIVILYTCLFRWFDGVKWKAPGQTKGQDVRKLLNFVKSLHFTGYPRDIFLYERGRAEYSKR